MHRVNTEYGHLCVRPGYSTTGDRRIVVDTPYNTNLMTPIQALELAAALHDGVAALSDGTGDTLLEQLRETVARLRVKYAKEDA